MFNNFKAGWSSKGKHRCVAPRLVRAYQEKAQGVLRRKVEIGLLTKAVATSEPDIIPTAMMAMNLPFIIGGVWAARTFGPKSKEYGAILDGLIRCAQTNYAGPPK